MQRRSRLVRQRTLGLLGCVLKCLIGAVAIGTLLAIHQFPSSSVPTALSDPNALHRGREIGVHNRSSELTQEFVPPQLSKLEGVNGHPEFVKLWKQPLNRDIVPCLDPSESYLPPGESQGYLLVHTNGGLNQMRAGVVVGFSRLQEGMVDQFGFSDVQEGMICDMVAIARIVNATLVIPKLDKGSFWQDSSNFSDVFDEEYFIYSLSNDVKVVKKLPKELKRSIRAVKHFRSWSGIEYYEDEISRLWDKYKVIRAAKSDSRLANNNLPYDIQRLRCRAFYKALRFTPQIEALGKSLVERMRSYGPYIALHLRYEKDVLAFSGCSYGLSPSDADELARLRENVTYWKVKDIDPIEQRVKGYCPLTPKEIGFFLSALGYPSTTPIYIAAGEIYGGNVHMADLETHFRTLMNKAKLASAEELGPFKRYPSQMAALDYIVSVESVVFVPSYSGNMARVVAGHRRFLGHRKTITPHRKELVRLFDEVEQGTLHEGKELSNMVINIHKRRQGSPRKRKGPISGTKGRERFRSKEAFYENPLPECLCQKGSTAASVTHL